MIGKGSLSACMDPVDLLVFGPHPDDLEIGLGGTIARHVALGYRVGLCDLTAGEMGSNGTVEERLAEAEAARAVLGARWRINLRWPDRAIGSDPDHVRAAARLVRDGRGRGRSPLPYGGDRHPDHVAAHQRADRGDLQRGPAALRRRTARRGSRESVCYYFINDAVAALVRRRRVRALRSGSARRWRATARSSRRALTGPSPRG